MGCRSGPEPKRVVDGPGLRPIRPPFETLPRGRIARSGRTELDLCPRGKSTAAMGYNAGEASGRA
jgi:hypothetical protein